MAVKTRGKRTWKEEPQLAPEYPFSVVIPAYNRAGQLTLCTEALAENELEHAEVLLVDDASEEVLQPAALPLQESGCRLRVHF